MPDPVRLAVLVTLAAAVALSACGAPRVSPPHEGYVQAADGVELYYRTLGQAADTVVVVRGGLGLDHGYLAPDLEPLAESFTLVVYDQRGKGRSTPVSDPDLVSLEAHVADLDAVRGHFGLERVALLGHSWGGLLAAQYALARPDRVSRLVLVSPGPIRNTPYIEQLTERVTAWMDEAQVQELAALQADFLNPELDTPRTCRALFSLLKRGFFYDTSETGPLQEMRGDFCGASAAVLRNFATSRARTLESLGDFDWREEFAHLGVPVLVITGVRDVLPEESFREWAEAFPQGELVLLDEAGHYPHVERPEAFFPEVVRFLR
jgi:proline iminopeptidase